MENEGRVQSATQQDDGNFSAIFRLEAVGIAQADAETARLLRVNEKLCEITGYSEEELLQKTFAEMTHPGDRLTDWQEFQKAVEKGTNYSNDKRYIRKDGRIVWVHVNVTFIRQPSQPVRTLALIEDITERKEIEAALHRERELLQSVVDNIPVMLSMFDPAMRHLMLNREFQRVTGYSMEDCKGDLMARAFPDPDLRAKAVAHALNPSPGWTEWTVTARDGTRIISRWAFARLSDRTTVCIGIDLREQKRVEEELRQAHERSKAIINSITECFFELNHDWQIVEMNGPAAAYFGRSREQMIGKNHWEILPGSVGTIIEQTYREAMATRKVCHYETPSFTRKGLHAEAHVYPSPRGISIYFRDITERKNMEQALRESEERYRTLAEAAHDMIFVIGPDDRVEYVNSFAARQFDAEPQQLIGRLRSELFPNADSERQQSRLKQIMVNGDPLYAEAQLSFPRGKIWLGTWLVPLRNSDGGVRGILGVSRDITERKRAEEELGKLNARLEEIVIQRTRQLQEANEQLRGEVAERKRLERDVLTISEREQQRIGHDLHDDLQQQLAGIGYLCDALSARLAQKEVPEAPELDSISGLLQKAIVQSRGIARGLCPVEQFSLGLMRALEQLATSMRDIYKIECQFDCLQDVPVNDMQIATHLYRIAQEAVHNAIKHGHASRVTVTLVQKENRLRLVVADNGQGMPAELPRFTGMGLGTMKYRAEAIGGTLEIGSNDPTGTIVTCSVPEKA